VGVGGGVTPRSCPRHGIVNSSRFYEARREAMGNRGSVRAARGYGEQRVGEGGERLWGRERRQS
jgi:hypothetical protein